MSDIAFDCPKCGKRIDAPAESGGNTGRCPACKSEVEIPKPEPMSNKSPILELKLSATPKSTQVEDRKVCSICGEINSLVASRCKHCDSKLSDSGNSSATKPKVNENLGLIAILLPFIGAFVAYFWIGSMRYIDDPAVKLSGFVAALVAITAILVALEASAVDAGGTNDLTSNDKQREGPVKWFIAMMLIWFIALPMWGKRRALYGLRNLFAAGLSSVLFFTCSIVIVSFQMDDRIDFAQKTSAKVVQEMIGSAAESRDSNNPSENPTRTKLSDKEAYQKYGDTIMFLDKHVKEPFGAELEMLLNKPQN